MFEAILMNEVFFTFLTMNELFAQQQIFHLNHTFDGSIKSRTR